VHRRFGSRHVAACQHGASADWFNPSIAHQASPQVGPYFSAAVWALLPIRCQSPDAGAGCRSSRHVPKLGEVRLGVIAAQFAWESCWELGTTVAAQLMG
jgi:hypothetical protein